MVLLLLVVGLFAACGLALGDDAVAYIQIVDFVEQNKTGPNNPALVLTEKMSPSDLFAKPKRLTYDLYELGYMEAQIKEIETVNASTYELSLQRISEEQVMYQHPFEKDLSLGPGENAAIFVDENKGSNTLLGSVCHTGETPTPGPDKATVILCPADPIRFSDLTKFEITGSNTGCLGCKEDLDLKPVKDSLHFTIDDTNNAWNFSIFYHTGKRLFIRESCQFQFGNRGVYMIVIKKIADGPYLRSPYGDSYWSSLDDLYNKVHTHFYGCYVYVRVAPVPAPSGFWLPIWRPILLLVIFIIIIVVLILIYKNYPRLREEILKKLGRWEPQDEEKQEEKTSTRLMSPQEEAL